MPFYSLIALAFAAATHLAHAVNFQVGSTGGAPVSPLQYGVFFEDINHSGDGGLYAELLSNRAFQGNHSDPGTVDTLPWSPIGGATLNLITNDPSPLSEALAFSISVEGGTGQVGLTQNGFWGISVQPQTYSGHFYIKGDYNGQAVASLGSNEGGPGEFGTAHIQVQSTSDDWTQVQYQIQVTQSAPNANNNFTLTFDAATATAGSLQLNLISLFPPTFNDRPNGLRPDMMRNIQDLNPSFLRFPGGNNLEGDISASGHWQWNNTIGPLKDRPGRGGQWGYYDSDGLGLDEYFQWAEDLSLEPILAIWDGLYLGGPGPAGEIVPQDALQPAIDDVLNELEYILGDESSTYGGQRCNNGHNDPYKLKYVEIGNEDNLREGLSSYIAYRFQAFQSAIKQAYPELTVIASTEDLPASTLLGPGDAADYHQYTRPDYFVGQSDFFDLNTTDHQILIGEYGAVQGNLPPQPDGSPTNSDLQQPLAPNPFWIGSVSEAVFLLGAERNAQKMLGAAYAPLFKNVNSFRWSVDLISFSADPATTFLSTSYQVLQLLGNTRFTQTRPTNVTDQPGTQGPTQSPSDGPVYYAAGENTVTGAAVLKLAVYNASGPASASSNGNQVSATIPVTASFDHVPAGTAAQLSVLSSTSGDPNAMAAQGSNPLTLDVSNIFSDAQGVYAFQLPDLSVAVLATQPAVGGYVNPAAGTGGYGGCKSGGRESYDWQAWLGGGSEGTGCAT